MDLSTERDTRTRQVHLAEALSRLPRPDGARSVPVLEHGSLVVKLYAPRGHDPQEPHTRDEVYVVAQGRGTFFFEGERAPFEKGDVLFAPAGTRHRFETFTDDLAVWVLFYGPEGGES